MKKLIIFIIAMISLTSCHYYPVEISYIRLSNPADTITVRTKGWDTSAEYIGYDIKYYNGVTSKQNMYELMLWDRLQKTIVLSSEPIVVTSFKTGFDVQSDYKNLK